MSKSSKPLLIIILAVAVAGSAAFLMSRQQSPEPSASTAGTSNLSAGGGRIRGPQNAQLTLVEFGDYQCPSCAAYHPIVNEVMSRFPNQVKLEFHHYPLISIHPHALTASVAAEAAGEQGRYWEMHDLIFENQKNWSSLPNAESEFLTYASRIGLNINQFMQAMRNPEIQQRVLQDVTRAREAAVEAVPTFFINGRKIPTPANVTEFTQVIQENLQSQ